MANARKSNKVVTNNGRTVAAIEADLVSAFASQAASGKTARQAIVTLFTERKALGVKGYSPELRDSCHKGAIVAELSIDGAAYDAAKADAKLRAEGWKAADMRFRANWSRALKDAGIETTEDRGGARETAKAETVTDAPVTIQALTVPKFHNATELRDHLMMLSTHLNRVMAANADIKLGDYGMGVRDTANAFGGAARRPLDK